MQENITTYTRQINNIIYLQRCRIKAGRDGKPCNVEVSIPKIVFDNSNISLLKDNGYAVVSKNENTILLERQVKSFNMYLEQKLWICALAKVFKNGI